MAEEDPREEAPQAEALGRAIKVYRTAQDMSRKELAERSKLSYSYLAEIENGAKFPSTKALHLISKGLGLSPAELLQATETLPPLAEESETVRPSMVEENYLALASEAPPQGARARQRAWFHSELPSLGRRKPGDDRLQLKKLLLELESCLAEMEPSDRERVLDLARRLAHR